MANDIIITPGSASIQFSGSSNASIKLNVDASGSLLFSGNSGSLFGITDNLSGSLMSVNTIAGLPILEVFSDNRVNIGKYASEAIKVQSGGSDVALGSGSVMFVTSSGRVGVGINTPVNKLDVAGNISASNITASLFFGTASVSNSGSVTLVSNNANYYFDLSTATSGIQPTSVASGLTFNPSTNTLSGSSIIIIGSAFTGSYFGTSSWAYSASNAVSASYAPGSGLSGGTTNYIPLWTSATTQGSSLISQSSNLISISGNLLVSQSITSSINSIFNSVVVGKGAGNIGNNTAVGSGSLTANTTGTQNSAFGYQSLLNNTSGKGNTAFGYKALQLNTTSSKNNAFGAFALSGNVTGLSNNAFGYKALQQNATGNSNNAFGYLALTSNLNNNNNAFGHFALASNTSGLNNNAFGHQSLQSNTTGSSNNGFGYRALYKNVTNNNNAFGHLALSSNTLGTNNSAFGHTAMWGNTIGINNSAFGRNALISNISGNYNSAFGFNAASTISASNSCSFFGVSTAASIDGLSNSTAIGFGATITANNQVVIGNTNVTQTLLNGNVGINTATIQPVANPPQLQVVAAGNSALSIWSTSATSSQQSPQINISTGILPFSTSSLDWRMVVVAGTGAPNSRFYIDSYRTGSAAKAGSPWFQLDDLGNASFPNSNLIIGATTPTNTLDVKGNMAIGNSYAGTNTALANGLIVQGVVGIGTTNPAVIGGLNAQTKLDIFGASAAVSSRIFSNSATGFSAITLGRTTEDVAIGVPGNAAEFVADSNAGELIIKNNGSQAIRIGSGAGTSSLVITSTSVLHPTSSVGIGSNSPVTKFDVVTTSTNAAAKFVGLVGVGAAPATTNPGQIDIVGAGATSTTFPFKFDNVAFDTSSASNGHTFKAWLKVYVANTTGFVDGTSYYIPIYV